MSSYLVIALLLFAIGIVFAMVIGGWREAFVARREHAQLVDENAPHISLVIPARNEEANITAVLQDLFAQRYPRDHMEVLVVDDGSTDGTAALVQAMIPRWPQLRLLSSAAPGKKAAITTGVLAAGAEMVILTDADVHFGPERVRCIVEHWRAELSDMIVLPVFTEGHGALGRLQEEEQAALLGMALGSSAQAYGANLAFTREAFLAVGGYEGDRFASGDDLFLLQRMQRAGMRITALGDARALVTARAAPSFGSFLQQRLRWAGKMRGAGFGTVVTGILSLSFPWILLWHSLRFDFVGSMGEHALYALALLASAWACWLVSVISLVRTVRIFAGRTTHAFATLFGLIAFSFYAPLIALVSLAVRPKWKGRDL